MQSRMRAFQRLLVPLAMGAVTLSVAGFDGQAVVQAAGAEMKVEVTITDKGYEVKGHTTPGSLTAIVVRNRSQRKMKY